MSNIFKKIPSKDRLLFILLLILIIALPITIYLVKQGQDIRSRARKAGGPAQLFFTTPNITNNQVDPSQTFTTDLYINSGGREVSGAQVHLSYPTDLLEVESIAINTDYFPEVLQNSFENGEINIAAGIEVLPTVTE